MGLLTGGLSFRRFRTYQPLPDGFRDSFLENLQRLAFQENLGHRSKEPVFGWTSIFNPDDTHFSLNGVLFDRYLVVGLRMDKKAVNGKLFQILLERRYRQVMGEKGVERLAKNHREEIKEALEEDLLGKALPSVNTYDVCWDIHTGEVLIFATSDAVMDTIQGIFHDTFGHRLYSERMVDWLTSRWSWEDLESRIEAHIPGGVAERELGIQEDGFHEGNPLKGRELVLGSEFLTWLWRHSEAADGFFRVELASRAARKPGEGSAIVERDATFEDEDVDYDFRQGLPGQAPFQPTTRKGGQDGEEEITLWLDNKLVVRDLEDVAEPGVTTMVGGAPSATPEAKLTISSGKRPVEARMGLHQGDLEYAFTLRAGPGGIELNGIKAPVEVKDGDEEKIYERMFLLDTLFGTLRGLFCQFFEVRTSDRWPGLIERWLAREESSRLAAGSGFRDDDDDTPF